MEPIGTIFTELPEKFGVPRQSGLVDALTGRIVLKENYRRREAFRELDGFSHLWLIWEFSKAPEKEWRPTVRPPRLGGNRRVGVFASRSPFRPNRLGLSCVRLERIDFDAPDGPVLFVSGIDMTNGTPIYDIKPYVPATDCRTNAAEGYTAQTKVYAITVNFPPELLQKIPPERREALLGILAHDPRPGYAGQAEKEYGLSFAGFEVGFTVQGDVLTVTRTEPK
ncbi:MAG: tRNA (N6-threonylcarbamoyladenosine(37)-N6)-methyltransferase TrmO [Clostridia bacterium]|nr:tRNA (N6-threonylcarbamoyladenosine(37)-N6)-methyltransferase TrmO [Clostridia bacterium]